MISETEMNNYSTRTYMDTRLDSKRRIKSTMNSPKDTLPPMKNIILTEKEEMDAIAKIAKKYLGTEKIENIGICAMVKDRPEPIKIKIKKADLGKRDIENFFRNRREKHVKIKQKE